MTFGLYVFLILWVRHSDS